MSRYLSIGRDRYTLFAAGDSLYSAEVNIAQVGTQRIALLIFPVVSTYHFQLTSNPLSSSSLSGEFENSTTDHLADSRYHIIVIYSSFIITDC